VVYDHEFHEAFAVKTFQDAVFARDPGIAGRFSIEARTWVNLDFHQNVVQARFVQNIHGKPFLFLEYVTGGDLSTWVGTPRLTKDLLQVLRFAIHFCDGMNHALSKGIRAHRDVEPQNCLVTQDYALKVTDFGLAKVFDELVLGSPNPEVGNWNMAGAHTATGTHTGVGAGTKEYMAPEQFTDAKRVDARADVYSFGVMLFQMVTGRLPFEGRTWEDYARLHGEAAPPALESGKAALDAIARKCLAKVPGDRYAGFRTLREELGSVYESISNNPAPKPASGRELNAIELNNKGIALAKLGRPEEALAPYNRALALNLQYAEPWNNKGIALGWLGRYGEALACFDHALALDHQRASVWVNKGACLNWLRRYEEALACFSRARAIDPLLAPAWYNTGTVLASLGQHKEALIYYDRALDLDPQEAEALSNKGASLESLERYKEALDYYDRSLALNPEDAQAWTNKGNALARLGQHKEALTCYSSAIAHNSRYANAWFNKGAVLFNEFKRCREAIPCFEEAQQLGHPGAAQALTMCKSLGR
jgi:tetratricopeptide (TPR) repeat protein